MIILKNDKITASVSEKGAELTSLKFNGFEYIWEADPAVWGSSSPVLFPICGGLKDDRFFYDGRIYNLNKHGFVRREMFEVEEACDQKAVFVYKSNDMTREKFPFEFEFRVIFELNGCNLSVTLSAKNTGDNEMYFNFGGHPAFACPEGISSYDLIFEQKETLDAYKVLGNLLSHETDNIITDSNTLPLKDELFTVDSLLFKKLLSKSVVLKNRLNDRALRFDYNGFDFLTVWTKPGAKYICLEPWTGTPDFVDSNQKLSEKYGINFVKPGCEYTQTFTISLM